MMFRKSPVFPVQSTGLTDIFWDTSKIQFSEYAPLDFDIRRDDASNQFRSMGQAYKTRVAVRLGQKLYGSLSGSHDGSHIPHCNTRGQGSTSEDSPDVVT